MADRQFTPKEDALRKEALDVFNLSSNRFDIFFKCTLFVSLIKSTFELIILIYFSFSFQGLKAETKSILALFLII